MIVDRVTGHILSERSILNLIAWLLSFESIYLSVKSIPKRKDPQLPMPNTEEVEHLCGVSLSQEKYAMTFSLMINMVSDALEPFGLIQHDGNGMKVHPLLC